MEQNKKSKLVNLSNQANMFDTEKSELLQLNYMIMLGIGHMDDHFRTDREIPVSFAIDKDGGLSIDGLEGIDIADENNVKIYSDKKVTKSTD